MAIHISNNPKLCYLTTELDALFTTRDLDAVQGRICEGKKHYFLSVHSVFIFIFLLKMADLSNHKNRMFTVSFYHFFTAGNLTVGSYLSERTAERGRGGAL